MIGVDPATWSREDLALIGAGVCFVVAIAIRIDEQRDADETLARMARQREGSGLCEASEAEPEMTNDYSGVSPRSRPEHAHEALLNVPRDEDTRNVHHTGDPTSSPSSRGRYAE